MGANLPTLEEVRTAYDKMLARAKDYCLLYQMRGVRHVVDLFADPSECSQRTLEAFQTYTSLEDMAAELLTLAVNDETSPDVMLSAWTAAVNLLEAFGHEDFKHLWIAGEALGLSYASIEKEVEKAASLRGRPEWSGDHYPGPGAFIERAYQFAAPYFQAGKRPRQEALGRALFPRQNITNDGPRYYSDRVRFYVRKCANEGYPFSDYDSFLTYLKGRCQNY